MTFFRQYFLSALAISTVLATLVFLRPLEGQCAEPMQGLPFRTFALDERMEVVISSSNLSVPDIIRRGPFSLMYRITMPFGFEERDYPDGESPRRFDFTIEKITLRQALDLLVTKDPDYRWEVADGVVNIFPRQSVLDVKIADFTVEEVDLFIAGDELLRKVRHLDLTTSRAQLQAGRDGHAVLRTQTARINLDLREASLRKCLNLIVAQDGFHDWFLFLTGRSKKRAFLQFIPRLNMVNVLGQKVRKQREEKMLREGWKRHDEGLWIKGKKSEGKRKN